MDAASFFETVREYPEAFVAIAFWTVIVVLFVGALINSYHRGK